MSLPMIKATTFENPEFPIETRAIRISFANGSCFEICPRSDNSVVIEGFGCLTIEPEDKRKIVLQVSDSPIRG